MCEDEDVKENVKKLRKAERDGRNPAEHELNSVDENWIYERTGGLLPDNIFNLIKYLIERVVPNLKDDDWRSYKKMNEKIKAALDEPPKERPHK